MNAPNTEMKEIQERAASRKRERDLLRFRFSFAVTKPKPYAFILHDIPLWKGASHER